MYPMSYNLRQNLNTTTQTNQPRSLLKNYYPSPARSKSLLSQNHRETSKNKNSHNNEDSIQFPPDYNEVENRFVSANFKRFEKFDLELNKKKENRIKEDGKNKNLISIL